MNQQSECNNVSNNTGSGFLIIIVLYILLAIILGSRSNNLYF